ncbi:MAG TPA: tyrosine-type recombinase/integrase [Candidatus Kapabacteria bacterium]|jgi:integrase/recombinase XerC|nr:tyrosine-type recombinase/integrase [Ignavibacteria bacterium]HRE57170.1 tyrosine-type recombinase/integrase [Candidatus Kapabacteria bacterium]
MLPEEVFPPVTMKLSQLSDHIADFIISIEHKKTETRGTYQRALREFMYFFSTDRKFQFRVKDVERYKLHLMKKNLKPVSISTYLTSLRRFCQYLTENGIIERNPAKKVQGSARPQRHSRHFLTLDEIKILLDSIDISNQTGLRDKALILTMLGCACSEVELSTASIEDFTKDKHKWKLRVQGKGKSVKSEIVDVPPQTAEAIHNYVESRGELQPHQPLFASNSNRTKHKNMSVRGIREAISLRLEASNVKQGRDLRLTPFSLRHTAGILMAESGFSVEQVMERMRIEWRPTALLYFKQAGLLHSETKPDSKEYVGESDTVENL